MFFQKILLNFEPKQENLLPALKEIQKQNHFIPKEAVSALASYFKITKAAVFSAASFYDEITFQPPKSLVIEICDGANCNVKRGAEILSEVENFFSQRVGDTFNPKVEIKKNSCFGFCMSGPVMKVNDVFFEKVTPEKVDDILRGYIE